jgi:putative hemolysin
VYCDEQGGRLDIRTADGGGQYGVCVFPDGSECEEWAFYRSECQPGSQPGATSEPEVANPAAVFCVQQGGLSKIQTDEAGNQYGVCVFPDGSECDEWAFYRGECAPGRPAAAPTPTLAGVPAPDVAVEEILAQVQLPANAYSGGLAVLPLRAPVDSSPLWVLYSTGMRNYELDPVPSHFLAIFTRNDSGWQEVARIDLDAPPVEDTALVEPLPDYVDPSGVQQVAIAPDRLWLTVDGGAGAHSGTFQLVSFDGEALTLELAGSAASPGAGFVADVNQDGQNDVVLDTTDPYIFCYACGVRHPYFQLYTWLGEDLAEIEISDLMMGQRGTQVDQLNSEAISLAQAGLWAAALARIDEAVAMAGADDPPTPAGSLRWNQALIRLNYDAQLQAMQASAYPLLSRVFYGDYDGAVDLMRIYPMDEVFSQQTPLVVGTPADGWQEALTGYIVASADAALAVQPDLAAAHFMRAWARFLANPTDPRVRTDLAAAARLAPDDPFYREAAGTQPAANPTAVPATAGQPIAIQFEPGATSALVGGVLLQDTVQTYVLRALAGQTMDVVASAPRGGLLLGVSGADGQVLKSSSVEGSTWSGALPATQDYFITLSTAGPGTSYTVHVAIPPLAQ